MARILDRIWIRFGLAVGVAIVVTLAVFSVSLLLFWELDESSFYQALPVQVRQEYDELVKKGLEEGPRAMQIYGEYWPGDPWSRERWALLFALMLGLPFGLVTGFWVSRLVTKPLGSIADTANRVAVGDFSVRAHGGYARGEMADMVRDFNRMIDSLEALDQERRTTVASLSHELRTPLAVLSARLYAIVDGVIPGTEDEMRGLLQQSLHLGRLVADLHTISMAHAGRLSLQCEQLDLSQFVGEELERLDARLLDKGFTVLTVQATLQESPAMVFADPDRLRQILDNLVENCLRYAASGAWIGIEVRAEQSQIVWRIEDAGPGLPAGMREQPFRRFSQETGSRNHGSGLGLSIVQTLVEQQDGTVNISESLRGGVCVEIRFPVLAA